MYEHVIENLRLAYDATALERDTSPRAPWKSSERARFLKLLQQEGKRDLLEIGAGPGWDSLFFQENGLRVVASDLSPKMVKRCEEKGLRAHIMDFKHLDFPSASFDAIYALNCLLHVPRSELGDILLGLQHLLRASGLFYLAVYGGIDSEGIWPEDHHHPRRFFSFYTDQGLRAAVQPYFDILEFKSIPLPEDRAGMHAQRLFLRKRKLKSTT